MQHPRHVRGSFKRVKSSSVKSWGWVVCRVEYHLWHHFCENLSYGGIAYVILDQLLHVLDGIDGKHDPRQVFAIGVIFVATHDAWKSTFTLCHYMVLIAIKWQVNTLKQRNIYTLVVHDLFQTQCLHGLWWAYAWFVCSFLFIYYMFSL